MTQVKKPGGHSKVEMQLFFLLNYLNSWSSMLYRLNIKLKKKLKKKTNHYPSNFFCLHVPWVLQKPLKI